MAESDLVSAPRVVSEPLVIGAAPRSRFDDVRTIAVLRGGGLGDVIFAIPAMASLAVAYPHAQLTLLGNSAHRELLVDRAGFDLLVEQLPVSAGIRDGAYDPAAEDDFFLRNTGRFDLAIQLHGGGRFSNPFLLRLQARHTVGSATVDAQKLERVLPYLYYQHEVLRGLEVVGLAGAAPALFEPKLTATDADRERAIEAVSDTTDSLVVIHPGATDPRRRWPAANFARVAAQLRAVGARVVVVGSGDDAQVADRVAALAGGGVISLADQLDASALIGLLSAASLVIGNDSGPRHLAQALGTPTVGIFWFGNMINAAPFGRGAHRLQIGWITHCPVCRVDVTQVGWTAERCAHNVSFVADVTPALVYDDAVSLMATSLPLHDR